MQRFFTWLNRFGFTGERKNWSPVDAAVYAEAYGKWGGSFILHPDVIPVVSEIAQVPLEYFACEEGGCPVAVVPVWGGRMIAGNRKYLDSIGKKNQLDTGDNEYWLPIASEAIITLPFSVRYLPAAQARQVRNAVEETNFEVALARSHVAGEHKLARKFKYNQKRALRLFIEAGGEVCPIKSLSPEVIVQAYIELFETRWGFQAPGKPALPELLRRLHPYLAGRVLRMNSRVVAIQLVFLVENNNCVSAAYINGGYDPMYKEHSPGSILCYLNTEEAEQFALSKNKPLRYHFGKMDADYKRMWCYGEASYRV